MTDRSKLLDTIANGAYWGAGVTFQRSNAVPLEKYSVFGTLDAAKTYAFENPVAYPGQPIAVVTDENVVTLYVIAANATSKDDSLIEVSTSASLTGESNRVDGLIEEVNSAIDALEGRMDTAEDDIDALEGRMGTAEGDIDSLEGRMTTAEGDIDALEGRATALENKDKALEAKDEALEAAIAQALADAKAYADGLKHFSTKLVTSQNEMTELNVLYLMKDSDAVADGRKDVYLQYLVMEVEGVKTPVCIGDTTTDLDNYYTESEADAKIAAAVKAAKEDLEGQLGTLSSTHANDVQTLQDSIDGVAEDLGDEVKNREDADKALDDKITANDTAIKANAKSIEDLAAVVSGNESDIESKMTAVNTRVDNVNTEIAGIKTDIQNLNSTYATDDELSQAKTDLRGELTTAKEELQADIDNRYTKDEVYTKAEANDAITDAIGALDKEDVAEANKFVTAVSQENGVITVTRARPGHADIEGFDAQVEAVAQPLVDAEEERALAVEAGHESRLVTLETFAQTTVPNTYATKTALGEVDAAQKKTAGDLAAHEAANVESFAAVNKAIEDLGAAHDSELSALETELRNDLVAKTTTVNGKALSANVSLNYEDVGADQAGTAEAKANAALASAKSYTDAEVEKVSGALDEHKTEASNTYVPKTLTVNKKALSQNISLNWEDVGADKAGSAAAAQAAAEATAQSYTNTREAKIREDFASADSTLESNLRRDLVAKTVTVNGQALSANVDLDWEDVGADKAGTAKTLADAAESAAKADAAANLKAAKEALEAQLSQHVSAADGKYALKTTTINGKALSANVSLNWEDVGADKAGSAATAKSEAVADAKSYTDGEIDKVEEAYQNADTALGLRIDSILADKYVKYDTTTEFILDCGNAAGEHPVYNA